MDNQSLSLKEVKRQEGIDSIPDLKNVPQGALREFEWAISQRDTKIILKYYQQGVKTLYNKRRRLKNPVNQRTGKPLKPATIKTYQSQLSELQRDTRNYKHAIRLLIFHNYIEAHRTKARWIRQLKIQEQREKDFREGLTDQESRFVELYNGSPVLTAYRAGHHERFPQLIAIGRKYVAKPHIASAITLKKRQRIPGFRVVIGGGQGDGKPFLNSPDEKRFRKGNCVELVVYQNPVFARLRNRLKKIAGIYGSSLENLYHSDGSRNHRNARAFDLYHDLSSRLHNFEMAEIRKKKNEWVDIGALAKDIEDAEREFGINRKHFQGRY